MRKLSKKISMLMVLAMLVSLFSGIVSASAASAWSFASSKYDVDVKETITMDKNEYADFDLYKEGEEVTKATYTVKWASSDEDVVWVNAKTGQLRADKFGVAEAGDKAKISATFTNVKTKKSATRYFYIEIADDAKYEIAVNFGDEAFVVGQKYDLAATVKADGKEVKADVAFSIDGKAIDAAYTPAAAGEVTIVAVATVDGKEVAKAETKVVVAEAGLVSAKQITFDTVALTFGSADVAKAVAADKSKLGSVYLIIENEIQAFVEKIVVDEKNPAVANVTLYNSLMKGTTYKFTYGDKTLSVVGVNCDVSEARSISIATTQLPAEQYDKPDKQQVYLNLYNADGVLIKVVNNGFKLEALNNDAYNITDIYVKDNNTVNTYVQTKGVYFHKVGAVAQLKATYLYGYDLQGNKINDLVATGAITSYDANAYALSDITEWALDTLNFSAPFDNQFSANNSQKLNLGESAMLKFKFTNNLAYGAPKTVVFDGSVIKEWVDGNGNPQWAINSDNWKALADGGHGIIFESSNENVVLVEKSCKGEIGTLYAVGAGKAQVIVYRYSGWWDGNKQAIGVFNIEVVGNRTLVSANSAANKTTLSSSTDDVVKIYVNALDQIGRPAYDIGNVSVGVKLMYTPAAEVGSVKLVGQQFVPGDANDDGIIEQGEVVAVPYITTLSTDLTPFITYLKQDWQGKYFEIIVPEHSDMYNAKNIQIGVVTKQDYPYNEIIKVINISTKKPNSAVQFRFDGVKTAIDTNLLNWQWWNGIGELQTDIKLSAYDNAGYLVKVYNDTTEFYAGYDDAVAAHVPGTDTFYYEVTKDIYTPKTGTYANNRFNAVAAVSGSAVALEKYDKGSYVINAFRIRGDNDVKQYLATTTITVTDSTPSTSVIKKDNKLNFVTTQSDILPAIKADGKVGFYRNGSEIYNLTIVDVVADVHVNPSTSKIDRVNVKKIKVEEKYANNSKTFTWWIDVYMSYEVHNQ